jgi:HlyD family secretion protein
MARFPKKTAISVALGAAILGGGYLYTQHRALTVTPVQAERKLPIKVFGLGTVEARVLSKLGFKVSGPLIALQADHGDSVRTGQLLARINNNEQRARLAKAEAQVLSAEAALQVAQAAVGKSEALLTQRTQTNERRQALLARQAVSIEAAQDAHLNEAVARAELLVAKSEIEAAKAKVDDARAQREYERAILAQHELRAPFDGIVVQRSKELGSVLAPGESLFTLVAPETVWMLAYVDEGRAGDISVGQPAEVRLRSLPQQRFAAKVARIGIESDRVNEERRIYLTCETCPKEFFLGEQVEVLITTAVLDQALMLPEAAIEGFDGKTGTVWIVEDGQLRRRAVELGKRTLDGRVQVVSGLPVGAILPVGNSAGFREGRAVTVAGGNR